MNNKDKKINITIGCVDFLINEVTQIRKQNELLSVENRVMNNFFAMIDRLGAPKTQGYGTDFFWEVKKEFKKAVSETEKS